MPIKPRTTLLNFGGAQENVNPGINARIAALGFARAHVCGSAILSQAAGRLDRATAWARQHRPAHVMVDFESLAKIGRGRTAAQHRSAGAAYGEVVEAIKAGHDEALAGVYQRPVQAEWGESIAMSKAGAEHPKVRDWLRPILECGRLVAATDMTIVSAYLPYGHANPGMARVDLVDSYYHFGRGLVQGARTAQKPVCAVLYSRYNDNGHRASRDQPVRDDLRDAIFRGIKDAGCLYVAVWFGDQVPQTEYDFGFWRRAAEVFA
jgi:hypothetical protein